MTNISNKEELRKLIARYVRGKASKEEVAFLKKYYDYFDDQVDGLDVLTEKEKARLKAQMLNEIQHKLHPHRQINVIRIARIAAAILVLIAASAGIWFINQNGKYIDETVVHDQNLFVVDSAISNEKHIYLPDGSYVVLEPGSQLRYRKQFNENERIVTLEGEAYFDVHHDSLRPFSVKTDDVTTRVLGTAFSISSSEDSNEFSISVTRGKVEVTDQTHQLGILQKDDQLVLDRVSREVTTSKLNEEETAKLEPAEFMMDNMTVAEAIDIVSKRWNCTFEIKNQALKNCRFTTYFTPTDNLEEVVAVIATVIEAEYSIKKKVVFLNGDGCKE